MKIDRIETLNLRFQYPDEHGFRYGGGVCSARLTTLVRVHTDSSHVGVGSCYTQPALAHLVIEQLAPLLLGRDPREVEELGELMAGLTRWFGRKGAAQSALGALDVAFWDLRAQSLGQPLWKLFGGNSDTCPAYASALLWQAPDAMADEARRHVDNGFRRLKMRLGQGEALDLECVRAVRAAVGPNIDIMVDAGMRLDLQTARRIGAALEKLGVFWFEEPFEPENLADYAALRGTMGVPVAAGENEFGVAGFRELIEAGAVDIVQPDCSRCGGLSAVTQICQIAEVAELRVATHTWSDAVTVVANAHAVAASPAGLTVEVDQTGNPFIEELLQEPLDIRDGLLHLGEAPGLGVRLDEATIEKYRLSDPLQIPPGNYSDMVWGRPYFAPAAEYKVNS